MIRRTLFVALALAGAVLTSAPVLAQRPAIVVGNCGSATGLNSAGETAYLTVGTDGKLCIDTRIASSAGVVTNPTSAYTRPANTTAYSQNDLISNNTSAGSIAVQAFNIVNAAGSAIIRRLRLSTAVTTGWDAAVIRTRLWSTAPTYTNGDNGAYAVAAGGGTILGVFDITLTQYGDAASGIAAPLAGTGTYIKLVSGTAVYWDMQITSAAGATPISGQTFSLTAEVEN
jgi:hypothetical protein